MKFTRTMALAALCGAAMFTQSASAQSRQIPAPPQDRPVVVHSTTVHTVTGEVIVNGYVVLERGVITAVGQGVPPRLDDALLRDATGLHVYPGLIAADTNLGLTETGAVDVTQDHNEFGDITPEARAVSAVNPDTDLIPVARANGILTAVTAPSSGLISGRCSILRMDGWTWEDMAIDADAGLVVNWPRTEPVQSFFMRQSEEEQLKQIKENLEQVESFFDEALAYDTAKRENQTVATDLRFEAMRPFVRGDKPVFVRASASSQIESAVAWAVRRNLKIVIVGGHEADRVAELLVKHEVPVIVGGLHRLPSQRHADYDEPFTLPLRLKEAGVKFCIASGAGAAHERNLNHIAATAAAYGLSRADALKSVTLYAADILGLGETHGSIETGKAATLIVTTGDPLEITTDVIMAFIEGREIDLGSRHKSLYLKYREKYRQLGLIE